MAKSKKGVYQTTDLQSVFNQCETTRKHCLMSGLTADTGMGKTTSLKAYATRQNVFMVTVVKTMNAKQLFLSIARELGLDFDSNIHSVMIRIADELNDMNNPLLIIDEAGKLNHTMMLYLHDLRERTLDNCGILLSGMPYFKRNLQKQSDRQKEGCSEFLRRVNIWHELQGLSRAETETICTQYDVTDSFKPYYGLRFADLMNKILLDKITNQTL